MQLIPRDIKFDANATPPQFTNNEDSVIEPGTHVRVKIIGTRPEVGAMFAIGSIKEDYLGWVSHPNLLHLICDIEQPQLTSCLAVCKPRDPWYNSASTKPSTPFKHISVITSDLYDLRPKLSWTHHYCHFMEIWPTPEDQLNQRLWALRFNKVYQLPYGRNLGELNVINGSMNEYLSYKYFC